MEIQSMELGRDKDGLPISVAYRKLGEHAFLIHEKFLILFSESVIGFMPIIKTVSDTIDMDPEYKEQVLKAFTQYHNSSHPGL